MLAAWVKRGYDVVPIANPVGVNGAIVTSVRDVSVAPRRAATVIEQRSTRSPPQRPLSALSATTTRLKPKSKREEGVNTGQFHALFRRALSVGSTIPAPAVLAAVIVTLAACGGSTSHNASPPLAKGHQKLEPGTYVLDPGRKAAALGLGHPPRFEITLPSGWFNFDGWGLHKGPKPDSVFVTFWNVDRVYPTPCKWQYEVMVDPGPDVDGLASALARQPLRNATAPSEIVLAGFRGKYLQWSVPSDIAFDAARPDRALFPDCDEDTFQSWTGAPGWASDRYQQAPGQVDRIWILDVDGERLVIDASYLPKATAEHRAELERVVRSIRFLD